MKFQVALPECGTLPPIRLRCHHLLSRLTDEVTAKIDAIHLHEQIFQFLILLIQLAHGLLALQVLLLDCLELLSALPQLLLHRPDLFLHL